MDHGWLDGALTQLADAAESVGLGITAADADSESETDAFVAIPGGSWIPVQVTRTALVSANGLQQTLRQWERPGASRSAVRVVVGDRITADARTLLRDADWGWLDLRGHLHLQAPGLFVDANLAPLREPQSPPEPFAGRVGLEVAVMILAEPHKAVRVRALAGELGRAPSSVSAAVGALRRANLVDNEGTARLPDLFWELASVWKPKTTDVKEVPVPGAGTAILKALRVNIDDCTETGWALTDARAAAAYGAPIAVRADQPPDFYVPDERVMRRAVQLLGTATGHSERGATLRVVPAKVVCARRVDPTRHGWNHISEPWPLAHPLFVALDLAQDPGRGRDVLNDWTPPQPWSRVW